MCMLSSFYCFFKGMGRRRPLFRFEEATWEDEDFQYPDAVLSVFYLEKEVVMRKMGIGRESFAGREKRLVLGSLGF